MPALKYWNGTAWELLAGPTPPEVHVGTASPAPRVGQLLWVDTDEPSGLFVRAWAVAGPWPQSFTWTLPFKADVLCQWGGSCFSTAIGPNGLRMQWDSVLSMPWADYYFNEPSSHKWVGSVGTERNMPAGSHTWTIHPAYGTTTSDGADIGRVAWTCVAVP